MPTRENFNELIDPANCDISQETMGIVITSKKEGFEGKKLFLPNGNFWSSEVYSVGGYSRAFCLQVNYLGTAAQVTNLDRHNGQFIRPVQQKQE